MKTKFYAGLVALVLIATGCSQEVTVFDQFTPDADNAPIVSRTFTAVMEQPVDTRATVGEQGKFVWAVGDPIKLIGATTEDATIASVDAQSGIGTFSTHTVANPTCALYPAQIYKENVAITAGVPAEVTLPANYGSSSALYNTSNPSTNAPMYAALGAEQNTANFSHLAGVLTISFTNVPAGINQFVFTSEEHGITGDFVVTKESTGTSIKVAAKTDTNNSVCFNFAASTAGSTLSFYVPLPVGTYKSFTVALKKTDKADGTEDILFSHTVNTTNGQTINRRALAKLPALAFEGNAEQGYYQIKVGNNGPVSYIVYNDKGLQAVNKILMGDDYKLKFNNRNITLASDIDLTVSGVEELGVGNWRPLGMRTQLYIGVFEGNNYFIKGLNINTSSYSETNAYTGLVGYLGEGGCVRNVRLIDCTMTSTHEYLGGIVGRNSGGKISACSLEGTITLSGEKWVGGIVGYNASGIVDVCSIKNLVGASTITGKSQVGGIVGYNVGKNSSIVQVSNCNVLNDGNNGATITITETSGGYAGGIVGSNQDGCIINHCKTVNCNITGATVASGGIAGVNHGITVNCITEGGSVTGPYRIGGVVGQNNGSMVGCYANGVTVTMNKTHATEAGSVGGIVGLNAGSAPKNAPIIACYAVGCNIKYVDDVQNDESNIVGLNSYTHSRGYRNGEVVSSYFYEDNKLAYVYTSNKKKTDSDEDETVTNNGTGQDGSVITVVEVKSESNKSWTTDALGTSTISMNEAIKAYNDTATIVGSKCRYKWTGSSETEADFVEIQ